MNKTKCEKGHFYDSDRYESCPHCAKEMGKKAEQDFSKSMATYSSSQEDIPTVALDMDTPSQEDVTISLVALEGDEDWSEDEPLEESAEQEESFDDEAEEDDSDFDEEFEGEEEAASVGKTRGIYLGKRSNKGKPDEATRQEPKDPVVGWLICVQGEHFGRSFEIHAGRNSIGRSPDNDISLVKETAVSRENHAVLIYDHKKRIFFVQAGEGKNLTYLNDDIVMTYEKLKKGDIIEVGDCRLYFEPLCDDSFKWESFIV